MDQRGTLGIVAALGSLWSGTAVFSALRRGINHTWGARDLRGFLVGRATDFLMFLFFAAAAVLLLVYTTIGNTTVQSLPDWARGLPVFNFSTRILVELGAFAGTWGAFMLLYRFVPHIRIEWRDVWLGAAVGAGLFQLIRLGFAWFAANIGNFNVIYGSLGALVAVMVWAYASALAVLLGSQVAATHARTMGSLSTPEATSQLEAKYGDLLSREAWLQKLRQLGRMKSRP
jgi:membrane protein